MDVASQIVQDAVGEDGRPSLKECQNLALAVM
jgi:hypothetical protein